MEKHRDEELPHEFVDLFIGGGAVIPGHLHPDVGRDDLLFQFVELVEDALGHGHGVGAGALGHGHGHRRDKTGPARSPGGSSSAGPEGDGAHGHRLFGAVDDLGHVLEIDRFALVAGPPGGWPPHRRILRNGPASTTYSRSWREKWPAGRLTLLTSMALATAAKSRPWPARRAGSATTRTWRLRPATT